MKQFKKDLRKYADKERAKNLQWFFKTGKGQYGEGDVFLGLRVPEIRSVVKDSAKRLSLDDVQELLGSKYHEERLAAVLVLVEKYQKGDFTPKGVPPAQMASAKADEVGKKMIYDFYLANGKGINNWDLVDLSAPRIVGGYLLHKKDRKILYKLMKSKNLWEKRIAIIATAMFIRDGQFEDTLKISKMLLSDKHDLIHKAVGWMLREVGKKDRKLLEKFLKENYSNLPRTTLRYAIERFEEVERKKWLGGEWK
jgi:3-methyladenine DNA glycosylase AlkD